MADSESFRSREAVVVVTSRLLLVPATIDSLQGVIAGDDAAFRAATGWEAPATLTAPPLMADALPYFIDALRNDPEIAPWWARWIIDRGRGRLVGSIGGSGRPDAEGIVVIGYAVYEENQRRGYASEAAAALTAWLLEQPGVSAVRATIPRDHTPSERVAAAAGLAFTGRQERTDDGDIGYWERRAG